jgi:hypothetical protein
MLILDDITAELLGRNHTLLEETNNDHIELFTQRREPLEHGLLQQSIKDTD